MRVCHVCSGHSADDGRVYHRACRSLADAGYDVHLVAVGREEGGSYQTDGVTVHPLPRVAGSLRRITRRTRVARMAAAITPDLFHVHEPELLAPVVRRAGARPVIWDVHESYLDRLADRPWIPAWLRPAVRTAWDRQERRLVRRCAGVVVATDRLADRYRELGARVEVVANYPITAPTGLATDAGAVRDPSACVFTGTIDPDRGLMETIEALALLEARGVDVSLDLAGPAVPGYAETLLRHAGRLGVGGRVRYHGYLTMERARALQRTAAIGLVPHLPRGNNLTAWPVKMFEFMAAGLPMVYSDLPSHQEIAGACGAGVSVDPTRPEQIADGISRLARDPGLARELGENGRRAVLERYNWGRESVRLLDLYKEVLG